MTDALRAMRSSEQATHKYLNSTCYFMGPLLAPAVNSSEVLGRLLNATMEVTQVQDPWGSGAVLKAMQVGLPSKKIMQGQNCEILGGCPGGTWQMGRYMNLLCGCRLLLMDQVYWLNSGGSIDAVITCLRASVCAMLSLRRCCEPCAAACAGVRIWPVRSPAATSVAEQCHRARRCQPAGNDRVRAAGQ